MEMDNERPEVTRLSWDTEGGSRTETNLLRSGQPMRLRMRSGGQNKPAGNLSLSSVDVKPSTTTYRLATASAVEWLWGLSPTADSLRMTFTRQAAGASDAEPVELVVPFDPRVTPTTVLPSQWDEDSSWRLPAVINAPDFGQMLLSQTGGQPCRGRLEGSRAEKIVDVTVELPPLKPGESCTLSLTPVRLPAPRGLADQALWEQGARLVRGLPASARGAIRLGRLLRAGRRLEQQCHQRSGQLLALVLCRPGPVDASTGARYFGGGAVRRTLDWWLDQRTRPTGEVVCYWDHGNFLDANAGPLIAAWDYVEATGDKAWLDRRIERLEFVADFLARRDVDNDGLVEAVQSGNPGTLRQPGRSCAWFDSLNCGHKDGYTNATLTAW